MSRIQISYAQYLRSLTLLHLALMFAQLIFIAIIFVLVNEESSVIDIDLQNAFLIGLPCVVLALIFSSRFFYQQSLRKLESKKNISQKLIRYRSMQIIQYAFCEASALGCFMASFLSQNTVFVYGSIGVLLYFMSLRPTKIRLEKEIAFDFNEQNKLSDPHFIVIEMDVSDID